MPSAASSLPSALSERMSVVLPAGHSFTLYHMSTPPTKCESIYSAPQYKTADTTFRESHLVQISVPDPSQPQAEVFVFAIECLIYTTRHLTTLFVSKADSTGFLSLLQPYPSHESPLRSIATTFIAYLVQNRSRPGIKLSISLFARASDQYLFPGSVENPTKHIADDRQLIKWWCRVLEPILDSYATQPSALLPSTRPASIHTANTAPPSQTSTTAQAYLVVPGEESISSFLPTPVRQNPCLARRWTHAHPLYILTRHPSAPPRCLIPHFPDDPKCRYLDELDDEIPDAPSSQSSFRRASPSKRGTGAWKSVKSLDQFWETMAFRSECASGRLVGFIWLVFTPLPLPDHQAERVRCKTAQPNAKILPTPTKSVSKAKSRLTGPIPKLLPRILRSSTFSKIPTCTPWYSWPENTRGAIVLVDSHYDKAMELLLQMDFAGCEIASQSTAAWLAQISVLASRSTDWGIKLVGKSPPISRNQHVNTSAQTHSAIDLHMMQSQADKQAIYATHPTIVNLLASSMVRKKPKKTPLAIAGQAAG